ncbi:MAG: GNAT family N-acetyltransferase [Anaerolineales bacterium]|nr:GNAT family N-acetyltransferase [Anaerolineales bacterium]
MPTPGPSQLTIRPSLPSDKDEVLGFCRFIWDGGDYISYVWDDWLSDPRGRMFTAEYAGHAVGLGRLNQLAPNQWWLEGLRVDPQHQDRKIGSALHAHLLAYWLEHGGGFVRLMTASTRVKVHHLCEQDGFARIAELSCRFAPALDEAPTALTPLLPAGLPAALDFLASAPTLAWMGGLLDLGWCYATPEVVTLEFFLARQRLYWWAGRRGLLAIWDDEEAGERFTMVGVAACAGADLPGLLRDFRRLSAALAFSRAGFFASRHPDLIAALDSAGFRPEDDETHYLYEKRHPSR